MQVSAPEVIPIKLQGIWSRRHNVNAVFVRKHDQVENLKVVGAEVAKNEIELNPSEWLVLLEGKGKYSAVENLYLDHFAYEFHIQAEDPIVDPFTTGITQAISLEGSLAALSVLVVEYLDFIDTEEDLSDETLKEFLDQSLHSIARRFDVGPISLQKLFLGLKWNTPMFWEEVELFRLKRQEMVDESNCQSRRELLRILDEWKHPKIFICTGIAHRPVFDLV